MIRFFALIAAGLFAVTACTTYSEEDKRGFDEEIKAYLKKEGIECTRASSGLYYKILEEGEGELIQYKDLVSFTYTGKLLNGTIVDEQKEPVEFQVDQLIGAWKEIMLHLRPGGKAYLVAPPQLGYGDHDLNDIPPNSILVFELEVVAVK